MKLVEEARMSGCKKCGEMRPYVLDFHHRDGDEKVTTINRMIKSASAQTLQTELKKMRYFMCKLPSRISLFKSP